MKRIIHLKTARVYSYDNDGMPKVERITVKLEEGISFEKFVKHMHLKGFVKSEPPTVVKVLEGTGNGWKEVSDNKYQAVVDKAMAGNKTEEKVDYKKAYENQANQVQSLIERLEALENVKPVTATLEVTKSDDRIELEAKATSLGVVFRGNIGDAKLKEKIETKQNKNS